MLDKRDLTTLSDEEVNQLDPDSREVLDWLGEIAETGHWSEDEARVWHILLAQNNAQEYRLRFQRKLDELMDLFSEEQRRRRR